VNEHKRVKYLLFNILQTQGMPKHCISKEPKHAKVIRFGTLTQIFVETENIARKVGLHINHGKTKYMIVKWKNSSKQNKIGQLTIQN
jgi:antirestriction protein ArdC